MTNPNEHFQLVRPVVTVVMYFAQGFLWAEEHSPLFRSQQQEVFLDRRRATDAQIAQREQTLDFEKQMLQVERPHVVLSTAATK